MSWLSAALLCGLVARAAADQPEQERWLAAHLELVRALPCRDPQPRALPVAELLTDVLGTDESPRPPFTVLHRCEVAGCCGDESQVCAPIRVATVTLWFNVTSRVRGGRGRLASAPALNHTRCACRLPADLR